MKVLPLFKSHYSIGKSILTFEKAGSSKANGPDSIVDLVKEHKINPCVLVEDSFSGFLEAYTNLSEIKVNLIFGIRITFTEDLLVKNEESLTNQHKLIIFAKNTKGYKKLIKLYTQGATEGFYYEPRLDFKTLRTVWDDNDLSISVPFYDSFIFNNLMLGATCIPDFTFTKPKLFVEQNGLPFDNLISDAVKRYSDVDYQIIPTKTIYYAKKKDFKTFLTFKCIRERTTLEKPNLDHLSSDEFNLESWQKCNV